LRAPISKIVCLSIVFDDTFAVVHLGRLGRQETSVRINNIGTLLWEEACQTQVGFFAMMSKKDAIVPTVPLSKIEIINPKPITSSATIRRILRSYDIMDLEAFTDNKIFCMVEKKKRK
jgi:hypothetical protein